MLSFLLRRILWMIPTTIGIALAIFSVYQLAPGDPATVMFGLSSGGELATGMNVEAKVAEFRRKHGLDRHLAVQFLDWLGPINFSPDGHPAFDHPRSERAVRSVPLPNGGHVEEGEPLATEPLPRTPGAIRARLEAARTALVDESAAEQQHALAAAELVAAGAEGLPYLMSALHATRLGPPGAARRIHAALERASGTTVTVHPERERALGETEARARQWFRWYYREGGGARVANSGERPWGGLLCLEFGREMQTRTPVAAELGRRLAVTVPLALASILLSYLIAVPLGIFSARARGSRLDGALSLGLFGLYSIPTFWAGMMLILLLGGTGLGLFPVLGLHDKDADALSPAAYFLDTLAHAILPIVTLTYGSLAYLARQMRSGMLEVLQQDYIRTARAKGLAERVVVWRHALPNSLIPLVTLLGSVLPALIGGSVIVESVFDIPGMGRYAYEGLLRRDFSIVMATTVFSGILTQVGMLLSDVAYTLVDPRIRHG